MQLFKKKHLYFLFLILLSCEKPEKIVHKTNDSRLENILLTTIEDDNKYFRIKAKHGTSSKDNEKVILEDIAISVFENNKINFLINAQKGIFFRNTKTGSFENNTLFRSDKNLKLKSTKLDLFENKITGKNITLDFYNNKIKATTLDLTGNFKKIFLKNVKAEFKVP